MVNGVDGVTTLGNCIVAAGGGKWVGIVIMMVGVNELVTGSGIKGSLGKHAMGLGMGLYAWFRCRIKGSKCTGGIGGIIHLGFTLAIGGKLVRVDWDCKLGFRPFHIDFRCWASIEKQVHAVV